MLGRSLPRSHGDLGRLEAELRKLGKDVSEVWDSNLGGVYGHWALLTEKVLTGHGSSAKPPSHPAVRQGTVRRRARGCGIHTDKSPTEQVSHALAACLWTSY